MARAAFVEPQLATLVDTVPEGPEWVHEVKFDGYRIECVIDRGAVRLFTRGGNDWTARFPGVAKAAEALNGDQVIFDGEVVALLPDGRSSFQLLQERLGADPPGQMVYYIFDLLQEGGVNLRALPLAQRKQRLRSLLPRRRSGLIRYSDDAVGNSSTVLAEACKLGLEGVVSKRRDAPYQSGRTRAWLKIKCQNRQEFVVVGFTEPKGGRVGIGALLLGVMEKGGRPRYAGRVGTGMNDALLTTLRSRLEALVRTDLPVEKPPSRSAAGVHWVEPRLVVEVTFTEWTRDGILRHPALVGVREDKSPREVRREDPMNIAGIVLSHADRVLYPDQGLTKQDVAAYYEAIAPRMLPHLAGRPLSLVRCPEGTAKACFFQKHWGSQLPASVDTVEIREGNGAKKPYAVVEDAAGLVSLVQHGVLEFHLWGSRADDVDAPDRLIFDLDPAPDVPWKRVQEGARALRAVLEEVGLESWIKTTGGKGIHVVAPVARRSTWEDVAAFARALAYHLEAAEPGRYLAKASKSARKGKIFVDWLRNTRGATAVAAWSTRARSGAPLSVPIAWEELDRLKSGDQYNLSNVTALLRKRPGDPWSGMLKSRQRLTRSMTLKLEA